VPDHNTLSRRGKTLKVKLQKTPSSSSRPLIMGTKRQHLLWYIHNEGVFVSRRRGRLHYWPYPAFLGQSQSSDPRRRVAGPPLPNKRQSRRGSAGGSIKHLPKTHWS